MAIANVVCRGFGSFGGGVNKVPTRGYASNVQQTSTDDWFAQKRNSDFRSINRTSSYNAQQRFHAETGNDK